MENFQSNIGYFPQMPVCDKHLSVEVNSDFSLPDYKSEIRRLLWTRVNVLPPSEYIGNGSAELSGEIVCKILYLGADGALYDATLNDTYSINAPFEFNAHNVNTDDVSVIPFCHLDTVNTRVLGPRKINVRTRVSYRAMALSPAIYMPELIGAHNAASIENLIYEVDSLNTKKCISDPLTLNDHISLDTALDSVRIVDASTSVFVSECVSSTDKISIKGDVLLKLLYCNDAESEHPMVMNRRLPFSATVYCDGISNGFECSAHGFVSDEVLNVEETGISVELNVTLCAVAQKNERVPYIADAYSTERATEAATSEMRVMNAVKCFNGSLTQNEALTLDEAKLSPDAKIIDVCGKVNASELTHEGGKLILKGSCDYQVVYYLDGEYSVRPLTSPMRYEFDCRGADVDTDALNWSAQASIAAERARSDGERLYIDSELNICCFVQGDSKISWLKEMTFGEKLKKTSGELVLCFPKKNTDIWSVAKLYGESQRRIRTQNSIPEGEDTVKNKYLVI